MFDYKKFIKALPILGPAAVGLKNLVQKQHRFQDSRTYWERRYDYGGDSGAGSYGKFAEFKAEFINGFVTSQQIQTVIEFGCGDGNQLSIAKYPRYLGFDVSVTAIQRCQELFADDPTKEFRRIDEYSNDSADLTLSLDVIYHLVEDHIFEEYMRRLFGAADRYVIIYSSDTDEIEAAQAPHVRHRKFTLWVETNINGWRLIQRIENKHPYSGDFTQGSFSDFFVYERLQNKIAPGS